jgi:hypothetical protein
MVTVNMSQEMYNQAMLAFVLRQSHLEAVMNESPTPSYWRQKIDANRNAMDELRKQFNRVTV